MEWLVFRVQGSASDPYRVSFGKRDSNLTARCNCDAAMNGLHCKHRIRILQGDTTGIVSDNAAEVATVQEWAKGTDVEAVLTKLLAAERRLSRAQADVKRLKKELFEAFVD